MASTSYASLGVTSGHGVPSDICAYNQSIDQVHKPASVARAEDRLEQAEKRLADLNAKEGKLDCKPCKKVFARNLEYYPSEVDDYQAYISHFEGSGACSSQVSNTDIYNKWAFINKWEPIEKSYSTKAVRNIAGGEISGGGETENKLPEAVIPEGDVAGPSPDCPPFAGPGNSLRPEFCGKIRRDIGQSRFDECEECLLPSARYPDGKLSECLKDQADLGASITLAESEVEELKLEVTAAIERAKVTGEATVCVNCLKDSTSKFRKAVPLIGGIGAGILTGLLVKNSGKRAVRRDREFNRIIQEDNNAKGFPSPPFEVADNSTRNGVIAGGVVGLGVYSLAKSSGHFGCSSSSVFGSGIATSGAAQGQQLGGATGLGGVLASLLGGGSNGAGTSGVVNGQGALPPGWVLGPNGPTYVGSGGAGTVGGPTITNAQIQQEIALANEQAALAQRRANQFSQFEAWQRSRNSVLARTDAELRAIGQNPLAGQNFSAGGSSFFNNGGASGVVPTSQSLLPGGLSLNLRAGLGVGVGGQSQVPFRTSNLDPRFQQPQFNNGIQQNFNNGFPQNFNNGIPAAPGGTLNGIPNAPGNVLPSSTTQPTGSSRLNF